MYTYTDFKLFIGHIYKTEDNHYARIGGYMTNKEYAALAGEEAVIEMVIDILYNCNELNNSRCIKCDYVTKEVKDKFFSNKEIKGFMVYMPLTITVIMESGRTQEFTTAVTIWLPMSELNKFKEIDIGADKNGHFEQDLRYWNAIVIAPELTESNPDTG